MVEIKLEKLNGHEKVGKVGKINKKLGEIVKCGDILLEIESNKGNMSIRSNVSGKLTSILVEEGDLVKIGDILVKIEASKIEQEIKESIQGYNYFSSLMKPQKQEMMADITIIGGGPGGYVAAIQAAKLGAKVILIEKERLGGTCLNLGCIPTKCLVKSSKVFNSFKRAEEFGLYAENVSVNIRKVVERKNKVVDRLVGGISYLLQKNNVKIIYGEGKILNHETVYVKEKNVENLITTKNIIIATGSKAIKPPIHGIEDKNVITSDEALYLSELPKKLVIVGGGIIGMEFAFIFNSFGVEVSVIESVNSILSILDEDICQEIANIAIERGIKIYTDSKVEEVLSTENNESIVVFKSKEDKKFICADKVLIAVGRKPYLGNLDLHRLKIELNDEGMGIKVNEKLQTNIPNIYAIGDVTNKIQLAHVASHQGIIAVKNILGYDVKMNYDVVPNAIFTDPEIAVVGISEREANEKGIHVEIGKFPFQANGKALTIGEDRGFIKIIKDKSSNKIIGGAIIGPNATDLIGEITLAIKNHLKVEDIIETIHAHPTTSEVIHEGALAVEGGAIHFA
ncbi:dihydrolipoyl dehydrogenase [Anaerobranca gottschalkii]|uniref:Dihydrolipoyl dehydrogenase n=1 Tax=Anaerobranca gottschalkii DSM 13577 TaxID=1120990 RepID=A0A1I0CCN0_9FIRM|nr:dihydrolipoyl dehydrogenase [Anaerobranca gottschalkii]SET17323.1 dihydrolipoamide dehydrogenase [Anaerobranca gottschalkii DSM 13577]